MYNLFYRHSYLTVIIIVLIQSQISVRFEYSDWNLRGIKEYRGKFLCGSLPAEDYFRVHRPVVVVCCGDILLVGATTTATT